MTLTTQNLANSVNFLQFKPRYRCSLMTSKSHDTNTNTHIYIYTSKPVKSACFFLLSIQYITSALLLFFCCSKHKLICHREYMCFQITDV